MSYFKNIADQIRKKTNQFPKPKGSRADIYDIAILVTESIERGAFAGPEYILFRSCFNRQKLNQLNNKADMLLAGIQELAKNHSNIPGGDFVSASYEVDLTWPHRNLLPLADIIEGFSRTIEDEKNGIPPVEEANNYILKNLVGKTFGLTGREVDYFLERHKEVKTKRPLTKSGKEHSRRLLIDIVTFSLAIQKDDLLANCKATGKLLKNNLQRLKLAKEAEDACLKFMGAN